MANRRMISKTIYSSYKFLTLSSSARDLYTYLTLYTDNDGICDAYAVLRLINGNINDLDTLTRLELIKPLNTEMLIYIVDFQVYNRLDRRGIPSPHRDLLLTKIPDIAPRLVDFAPRGGNTRQSATLTAQGNSNNNNNASDDISGYIPIIS